MPNSQTVFPERVAGRCARHTREGKTEDGVRPVSCTFEGHGSRLLDANHVEGCRPRSRSSTLRASELAKLVTSENNGIRVLKFVNQFFIGGTERQFVHVANGLDRSRFDVDLACFRRVGPLLDTLKPDLALRTYPLHGSLYNWRSMLSQIRFF